MRLRLSILILAFLCLQLGFLKSQSVNDTIVIQDVIVRSRPVSGDAGFKQTSLDSVILNEYGHNSLSEVLNDNSPIYIKSYGLGALATPSFRGTGAGHTQVLWNGTVINSPMLGQSDLSLIPAGMVDDIHIYYGGASPAINSGAIGGVINVGSKPAWDKKSQLSLNPGLGSFGHYSGLAKYITGADRFQSVTRAFINKAENDFRYTNSVFSNQPFSEKRQNAQVFQTGFMQEFHIKGKRSITSAHLWYQNSQRNLPAPMIIQQTNSGESQHDEFLRSILSHKIYKAKSTMDLSLSWFAETLDYKNSVASIDSKNLSNTLSFKSGFEYKPINGTILKMLLSDDLNIINSNNYGGNKRRNLLSVSASAEKVFGRKAGAVFLLRQSIHNDKLLIPDFSLGIDYKMLNTNTFFIKGNISRNSRIPTMNDLYWTPGGNTNLKNEFSYSYEVSLEINDDQNQFIDINSEITYFENFIHDMIQWQPGEFRYWTPINIGNVNSTGIEANLVLTHASDNFTVRSATGYALTKSKNYSLTDNSDINDEFQLIYVPIHQLNTNIRVMFKKLYSSWVFNYTSKRFITADNSQYLPGFSVNDLIVGCKVNIDDSDLDISVRAENIFSVEYQTIAFHPMPGQSIQFNILYKFNK